MLTRQRQRRREAAAATVTLRLAQRTCACFMTGGYAAAQTNVSRRSASRQQEAGGGRREARTSRRRQPACSWAACSLQFRIPPQRSYHPLGIGHPQRQGQQLRNVGVLPAPARWRAAGS